MWADSITNLTYSQSLTPESQRSDTLTFLFTTAFKSLFSFFVHSIASLRYLAGLSITKAFSAMRTLMDAIQSIQIPPSIDTKKRVKTRSFAGGPGGI